MRAALFIAIALGLAGQAPAPPPVVYKAASELTSGLQAAAQNGDMLTSAVSNTDHYRINLVKRTKAAGAVAHADGNEVHHIVEGAATFVTGGTIVRPAGGGSSAIQGGERRRVAKGDVVFIPAGTPHWYTDLDGTITYLEIRFNTPVK